MKNNPVTYHRKLTRHDPLITFTNDATATLHYISCLLLVKEYMGQDNLRVHFISDNLGLINRSKDHLTYTIPYVNTTIQAEHDLIEQIYLLSGAVDHCALATIISR